MKTPSYSQAKNRSVTSIGKLASRRQKYKTKKARPKDKELGQVYRGWQKKKEKAQTTPEAEPQKQLTLLPVKRVSFISYSELRAWYIPEEKDSGSCPFCKTNWTNLNSIELTKTSSNRVYYLTGHICAKCGSIMMIKNHLSEELMKIVSERRKDDSKRNTDSKPLNSSKNAKTPDNKTEVKWTVGGPVIAPTKGTTSQNSKLPTASHTTHRKNKGK